MNVQPVRVLLIEDNPADAALIQGVLADAPFAVEPAASLAAGLERLAPGGVDVVLLDLLLPDGSGLEALTAVQARCLDVPVVVLTGLESEERATQALQQGAQDYLLKGQFDGPALTRAVRYAVERKRLEVSLRAAHADLERRVRERTAELARSEGLLRHLLAQMPAILWTTDRAFRITFCAGAGLRSLHIDPARVTLGKTIFDYFETDDPNLYPIRAHQRALAGESVYFEMEWQGAVFQANLEPLRDGAGQVTGCIGVTVDVSERKRAELKRAELEACLRQKERLESLGALAGGVAHDFNNLLTGVLGNASLALMDLPPNSPAYEPMRQIEAAALRGAELTQQLLAYSGKGKFVVQPVDLSRLVEDLGPLLQGVLPGRALLRAEPTADVPPFEADAEQVRQVVVNLVSNAAEALPGSGGVITLRTGLLDAAAPFPAAPGVGDEAPPGRYVYLEVEDTGRGMDEATRRQLFEPFFSTKPGGRGLGLPAVLGIVRSHHGAIQVDSEPGRGTAVRVLFPVARPWNADHNPASRGR
jgi:PAS domain S-box-containing protein